jgi:hypothetical protein
MPHFGSLKDLKKNFKVHCKSVGKEYHGLFHLMFCKFLRDYLLKYTSTMYILELCLCNLWMNIMICPKASQHFRLELARIANSKYITSTNHIMMSSTKTHLICSPKQPPMHGLDESYQFQITCDYSVNLIVMMCLISGKNMFKDLGVTSWKWIYAPSSLIIM